MTRRVVDIQEDVYQALIQQSQDTKIPLKWIVDKLLRKELIKEGDDKKDG